jgi:hypothetical protein
MEALLALLALAVVVGPWILAFAGFVRGGRLARRIEALERRLGPGVAAPAPAPAPAAPAERPLETVLAPSPARASPQAPPPGASPQAAPPGTLEERIALVWLTRVGALVVLVGAATAFKWAVDNDWIGPAGRVALGVLCGAAAVAAGEALRARTRPPWVNAVQGGGVALLFLSVFAAASLYHLVPLAAGFAAVAVVAALGGALALRGRSEAVLGLSLLGGLAAPVLLSTGTDHPVGLLGWLLLVSGAALLASARLGFRIVPWLALAGTTLLFAGWYDRFFGVRPPPGILDPNLPAELQQGAYFLLSTRLAPLALSLAHLIAWLGFWTRARRQGPAAWPRLLCDAWLVASLAALHLAPFALLHDHPLLAGASVALAGLASAILVARADRPVLHPFAAALGGLLLAGAQGEGWPWLLSAAAWGAVHLSMAGRALLSARSEEARAATQAPAVVTAALAGLGFAGLAVGATSPGDDLLRAALAGAAAAAELALGAATLPRGRARATVLLGSALGLAAAAAGFLLSGAGITLAWAVLAAAVAVVAARDRDPFWLAGALALFALAVGRAFQVDLAAPAAARALFLGSDGTAGAMRTALLVNARGASFLGLSAALLVSARAVVRPGGRWRWAAAALATVAHGALLALAVSEARDAFTRLPLPTPPAGDALAFEEYRGAYHALRAGQGRLLDTVTTVVMGLYAAALVAVGFLAREVLHRWLGLALFAATLLKVLLSDVWRLTSGQRILVFMASGLLMLAAGFLYARHGKRLRSLLAEPPPGGGAALLLVAAALSLSGVPALGAASGPGEALDVAPFDTVRAVEGVRGPGLHALRVDAALWQASRASPGTLADVRLAGPDGTEVGWALRRVGSPGGEVEVPVTLVDPVVLPDGRVRALLDKGRTLQRSDELRLDLAGDDFLRRVRVESSEDGRRFGVLADGPRVYAVPGVPGARRTTVPHPPSQARWLRVTLLPGAGRPPAIRGALAVRRTASPPVLDALEWPAPPRRPGPDGKTSLYDLDLVAPGLPVSAVRLTVDTPVFERRIRVLGSEDGKTYAQLGTGLVFRVPGDDELRVGFSPAGRRFLRLEIQDGDAPPLTLARVGLEWPAQELVFPARAPGPHRLLVGSARARPARYDVAAVVARAPDAPMAVATLGREAPNPGHRSADRALPFTERHRTALAVGLLAVLAALAAFAVRLLRSAG